MMIRQNNKVVLVGDGAVGSAFAFSLLQRTTALDELVIVDRKPEVTIGDSLDLEDVTCFDYPTNVHTGTYFDARDAAIVVITAGVPRKEGETRLDLINKNEKILRSILEPIMASGFDGIFVISANPVDILTTLTQKITGFPKKRVIGTGTSLDTARLRVLLAQKNHVPVSEVNAYVMGEHGDTSFVNFEEAKLGSKQLTRVMPMDEEDKKNILMAVRKKGGEIIKHKGATYYGVARCLSQICEAILTNRDLSLPVSAPVTGFYGIENDLYIGTPAIINRSGIQHVIETKLSESELAQFQESANKMQEVLDSLEASKK